jgi:EAL domain-containing protein (putative c-di-GMP-specific phosphodiesterase class I)
MLNQEKDGVIVKATIDLAHNLGLKVVAEGVETKDIAQKLGALGCDVLQGYLFSRPIPGSEFEK